MESENNYVKYMNEFLQDKIEDVRTGNAEEGMDIMGQLVRTSYGDKSSSGSRKEASKVELPDSEIIGNAFSKCLRLSLSSTLIFTLYPDVPIFT